MSEVLEENLTMEQQRKALNEIEAVCRKSRGEELYCTPWDYSFPTAVELRQLREETGLSRGDVASQVNYTENYVLQVEHGHAEPGIMFLRAVLSLFKKEWPQGSD